MWYLGGTSTRQWDFLLSKTLTDQRRWYAAKIGELASKDLEKKQKQLHLQQESLYPPSNLTSYFQPLPANMT